MKVTSELINAFQRELGDSDESDIRVGKGLQAVLDLIMPDPVHPQRVYVDGDVVTVIDQWERPRLAYGLTRGLEYRISVDARPVPAERAP